MSETSIQKKINLSVYISEKSKWQKDEVYSRLIKANEAFSSCDITIGDVYVHRWVPSNPLLRVDDYVSEERYYDGMRHASVKTKNVTAIELFYFENYLDNYVSGPPMPLAVYEKSYLEPEIFDTAWFPYQSAQRRRPNDQHFSEEAHEIGHILLQAGHDHSGEESIMANSSYKREPLFTKEQCAKLNKHPAVNKNFWGQIFPLFSTYYQKYSSKFYMSDWCSRNVLNLSRGFHKTFGLDKYNAHSVFIIHKKSGESFYPRNARSGQGRGWRFHAFLMIDGMALDLDYGKSPAILPVNQYLQRMFGEQVKNLQFQLHDPLDDSRITFNQVQDSFSKEKSQRLDWEQLANLNSD